MTVAHNKNSLSSKQLKERLLVGLRNMTRADVEVEHKFHPHRRWRFDFYIKAAKLAVEVEGGIYTRGRHTNPSGFMKDVEKYNSAALFGIRVYRIPHQHLRSEKLLLQHLAAVQIAAGFA